MDLSWFRDLGFPAGVAVTLLWFAWHVSRTLLSSHQKFLDGLQQSSSKTAESLSDIERNLSAINHVLKQQSEAIDKLLELGSSLCKQIQTATDGRK